MVAEEGGMVRVVVVGAGIAGLAAAHRLRELSPDLDVVVLERADRLGGKIHTVPFAGRPVETGAETFLMLDRGQESAALGLARRLGLDAVLRHPAPAPAALAVDDALRPLPAGTLMGVPADPAAVSAVARVVDRDTDAGAPLLAPGADIAVGALVRDRFGDQVVDRLVDPLLGGVYAGRADELSLAATIPGLHRAAGRHSTLGGAVRQALADAPRPQGTPVFATVQGGLSRYVEAVAAVARADVRTGATVRELVAAQGRWRLTVGPTVGPSTVDADAVVLATPAAPAGRLLKQVDPAAAEAIGGLEYANVGLVTLALPPGTPLPALSGFLVPATEGRTVKAATFFSTKWSHLDGPVLLRASIGRHRDGAVLRGTDEALIALVRDELPALIGSPLPEPVAARVNRWGGGLPQYGVGHVDRVARVRAGLPPTIALAGAAYDGVGIASCVRSGEAAAEAVVIALDLKE
jgi:protoporphyrinogen/coproporphyrinogen III oxidase